MRRYLMILKHLREASVDDILLHPHTRQALEAWLARPRHGLLISGDRGVGTQTIAAALARRIASGDHDIRHTQPTNGTIPIEEIRRLYTLTRASRETPLVVVVDDAETMSVDGQNALLKLLEEPPRNTYFLLTSHAAHRLLPTIRSRVEHVGVRTIDQASSRDFLIRHGIHDASQQAKLLFLASGKPAELHRLVYDQTYFDAAAQRMSDAKQFLGADLYGRLVLAKQYTTDRDNSMAFLLTIGQLLAYSMRREVSDTSTHGLEAISHALDAIAANGNLRAHLLRVSDRISVV